MSYSLRHYLFPESESPLRLSQRLVEGLIAGTDALPQYAGTQQRILTAVLELSDGSPVRVERIDGSIWHFDREGGIRGGLHDAFAEVMNIAHEPTSEAGTVVSLRPKIAQKRLAEKYRWSPSQSEIQRVVSDIWPKSKADRLKDAKGISPRRPPLTSDASRAISQISRGFWQVAHEIDDLKEPGLKGLAFESRKRAKEELEYRHLFEAIANMADDRLQVLKRRKSGNGVWYALVEVTLWREDVGDVVERFYERCAGRSNAVAAARRLLAEHAGKFSEDVTIEASIMTDLEWDQTLSGGSQPND